MCYVYLIHKHLKTLKSFLYISIQEFFPYEVVGTIFVNSYFWALREKLPLFTTTFCSETGFKFFLPPKRICRCVTANMERIKPRVNPIQAFFPFEALGKTSSVTTPTVTWPTLRKQSIVQAKEVYSKCLVGINLVNRGQVWLKIAETSGYILSLLFVYDRYIRSFFFL